MENDTKWVLSSKEIWVSIIAVANYVLHTLSFPSIEPTPEFYTMIIALMAILRAFYTEKPLRLKRDG